MAEKKPAPPKLNGDRPYADWLRLVRWWKLQTNLEPGKQGVALASSLEGKALDAVLELTDEELSNDDGSGVDLIIAKLDVLYKKNTLTQKIEDIEQFESVVRPEHKCVNDYITEFDKCINKLKVHNIQYPEDVKGFKLLKGANVQPNEEKLIRATITDITYDLVLKKLKDIYGQEKPSASFNIKSEPAFYTRTETPSDEVEEERGNWDEDYDEEDVNDTFYTPRQRRGGFRGQSNYRQHTQSRYQGGQSSSQSQNSRQQGASATNWRNSKPGSPPTHPQNRERGKNPLSRMGTQTRCRICQSINHWAKECPDKGVNEVALTISELVLHASNDTVLKTLVSETWNAVVLDCGATSTVCGRSWFEEYTSSLNASDSASITFTESSRAFRFGDGKMVTSDKSAVIPAVIGQEKVSIRTDIVDADIPLLLSKTAMKNAKMTLNFDDDTLSAFDQKLPLRVTSNGLYSLPITKSSQLIDSICEQGADNSIVLKVTESKSDREIAIKLHRCFAHPSAGRLLRLVNSAGETWSHNENLKREIKEVTNNCDVCKVFKKPPPRPIVGLPMASEFQEVVAMDLKMYKGRQILHLVDLCTRLSAATFIADKKRDTIIAALFRIWISVYGTPQKFMSDNGGEFANSDFLALCEQFGIVVKTTPAESPWSNGVVERNNQTLARSMDKIIEDTGCHADMALLWALNAKNSLQNVAGFSPFQLVLGMNPRLPSTLTDELPSLTQQSMPQLIRDNLNALHAARSAFIACENDEKIRRALTSNVRTSGEVKYVTGDTVLYKRDSSVQWHGPATVIGQVDNQVFVKHGSFYIRVHPCRLQLQKEATRTVTKFPLTASSSIQPSQDNIQRSLGVPCYNNDLPTTDNHSTCQPTTAHDNDSNNDTTHNVPADITVDDDDVPADITADHTVDNPNTTADITNNVPDDPTVDNDNVPADTTADHTVDNNNAPVDITADNTADTTAVINGATADARTNAGMSQIKPGVKVRYRDYADLPIHEGIVTTRAGKVRGANRHWWNTIRPDGSNHAVDFNSVHEWEIVQQGSYDQEQCQETLVDEAFLTINKSRELDAKKIELEQWKTMGVYKEVDDIGQDCISLRWVLKEKIDDNGMKTMKARLCVRGFEEEHTFRTDSPTCSREGIRLFLSTTASNGWKIHSIDVKAAFLQGKGLEREVTIRPPKEAETTKLWCLQKCAYGLADAPRCWYLRLREELTNLGAEPSQYDNGIFFFKNTEIYGIMILHVDDIMWSGTEEKMKPIINKLKGVFQISHENENAFTYIGVHTSQKPDNSIMLHQSSYTESINTIPLSPESAKNPHQLLDDNEVRSLRGALGQLNWLSNMTRPDISFTVSKISGHIKGATVADIKETNKMIKYVKDTPLMVSFPPLDINSTQVVVYADSSFNNLDDGGSQGGQIVFLKDKSDRSCPISWRSTRVRRVARSTLAAESLAFADGIDTASFVQHLAAEFQMTKPNTPIVGITDSRSLYDAANTSTQVSDRRLRVEISAIRDTKEKGELEMVWTSNDNQLADVLTKKGASPRTLLQAMSQGRINPNN